MAFAKSYDRPYDDFENGINAVTVEDIRWLRCDIKSLNLLEMFLLKNMQLNIMQQKPFNIEMKLLLKL